MAQIFMLLCMKTYMPITSRIVRQQEVVYFMKKPLARCSSYELLKLTTDGKSISSNRTPLAPQAV